MNTMPSWQKNKNNLSHDDSRNEDGLSAVKNNEGNGENEESDENGHVVKSAKMFDSAPASNLHDSQLMETIPQVKGDDKEMSSDGKNSRRIGRNGEVAIEDSHLLGSDDFTGQGASIDIRKVLADGEHDDMGNKDLNGGLNGKTTTEKKKGKKGKKSKGNKRGRNTQRKNDGDNIKRAKTAGNKIDKVQKQDEDEDQKENLSDKQNKVIVTMSSPKS